MIERGGAKKGATARPTLADEVGARADRKLAAKRHAHHGVWFGLGMMGLVGWSVAIPTVLGAALGMWLDEHHGGAHPRTLALLLLGLVIGCLNAWHWVAKESEALRKDGDDGP